MSYPIEKMKDVFTILKSDGRKDRWLRVGIGFVNRDSSISIRLDAIPTNGTLHIRDYLPRVSRAGSASDSTLGDTEPTRGGFAPHAMENGSNGSLA